MPNKKTIFFLIIIIALATRPLKAQDPHVSQQFLTPLYLNPALTGNINDGDMRLGLTYRGQWYHITSTPYHTAFVGWDKQWCNNKDFFGTGLMIMGDLAGSPAVTTIHAKGSFSYNRPLGKGISVALGFEGGYIRRGLDVNNLQFDEQFDGKAFDPGRPSFEEFNNTPAQAYDLGAGALIQFDLQASKINRPSSQVMFGISAQHLNRPVLRFKDRELFTDNQVAITNRIKINAHLFGQFSLGDKTAILPRTLFSMQGKKQWEAFLGLDFKYRLAIPNNYLAFGAGYRQVNNYEVGQNQADAMSISVRMHINGTRLGLTYDYTLSELRQLTGWLGTFELSVVQTFKTEWGGNRCVTTQCPEF